MKLKQKTKISLNGSGGNSVNSTIPHSIRNALKLNAGDEIRWCAEVTPDGLIVSIQKVSSENNK